MTKSTEENTDMANGKGVIDCCYCKYFGGNRGYPEGHGVPASCQYHGTDLPEPNPSWLNRICCHFQPDESYWNDNGFSMPPARRFAWFARDLQPGVLYFFFYNTPEKVEHEVVLREPDYQAGDWKQT